MGDKGARQSDASAAMAAQIQDDLASLGNVTTKKMFGGHGVFEDGVMFALIDSGGTAFLRADDATAESFETAGAERHAKMPYWTIPQDVINDNVALFRWAEDALAVARAAKR